MFCCFDSTKHCPKNAAISAKSSSKASGSAAAPAGIDAWKPHQRHEEVDWGLQVRLRGVLARMDTLRCAGR